MNLYWYPILAVVALTTLVMLRRTHHVVQHTSLALAFYATLIAAVALLVAILNQALAGNSQPGRSDLLWFIYAILSLTPPMAVLGARRPGVRAWGWFVLVPMTIVLAWPTGATLWKASSLELLDLDSFHLAGIVLVAVMGWGNYLGTRSALGAVLLAGGTILLVLPCFHGLPKFMQDRETLRLAGTWLIVVGEWSMIWLNRSITAEPSFDRVWIDFVETFGLVWGRRLLDRVNAMAVREGWPTRLQSDGFHPPIDPADAPTLSRVNHTLRWLLRRFVDPTWIDLRAPEILIGSDDSKAPAIDS